MCWKTRKTPVRGSPRLNSGWVEPCLSNTRKLKWEPARWSSSSVASNMESIPDETGLAYRERKTRCHRFHGRGRGAHGWQVEFAGKPHRLHQRNRVAGGLGNLGP